MNIGRIIYFLLCVLFISGLQTVARDIKGDKSSPATIYGFFISLCLFIIIVVFLLTDISKLHIIWLLALVILLSRNKLSFKIGFILFNVVCLLLKKPNIINYQEDALIKRMHYNRKAICPKCKTEVYHKPDSFLRLLLIKTVGINSLAKYNCPNCGEFEVDDLPTELKKNYHS